MHPFALDLDFGAFRAQGAACCKTSDCLSQQSKKEDYSPSSLVSPWSDSTSKYPKSMVPNGTCCDVSSSSSSQHLFPLGADFGSPPFRCVFALQSALMWPMRPQRKHSLSVLPFPPPLVLPLIESCRGLVKTFLPFLPSKRYKFSIFTFNEFVAAGVVIAGLFDQVSHQHWSKTTSATVDDCHDVCPHLCVVWKQMLLCCQLSFKICKTNGEENSKSHVFG